MLTAVIILGIMLAGITGYLVWSATHNRYVKAEDIGSFKDSAPDMEMSGDQGIRFRRKAGRRMGTACMETGAERTLGQRRAMGPCI